MCDAATALKGARRVAMQVMVIRDRDEDEDEVEVEVVLVRVLGGMLRPRLGTGTVLVCEGVARGVGGMDASAASASDSMCGGDGIVRDMIDRR
jgi:hypothetical protein